MEVPEVVIEVNISSRGFPGFEIVGLAGRSIKESKERIKAGIMNSGFKFPSDKKIVINLAPADLPKEGSMYDLPITVGILQATGQVNPSPDLLYLGELSLDGSLSYTKGSFLLALHAKKRGYSGVVVPFDDVADACLAEDTKVYGLKNILELRSLRGDSALLQANRGVGSVVQGNVPTLKESKNQTTGEITFLDILGQEQAKRALQIAAAGGHSVLMVGPPGAGKSLLARSLTSLLPPISREELLEVLKIYSLVDSEISLSSVAQTRPFRSPHHTGTLTEIFGGGAKLLPGEVTLAHRGVLFLDELSEFKENVLTSLLQPMERGYIEILKNGRSIRYPSRFSLIGAANPCPCGYRYSETTRCKCTEFMIQKYKKRLSGPLLDRIDMFVNILPVGVDNLEQKSQNKLTVDVDKFLQVRNGVTRARIVQESRLSKYSIYCNSEMDSRISKEFCRLDGESRRVLNFAVSRFGLTMRSYLKIIKVARTIADIEGSTNIVSSHILEALSFGNSLLMREKS
jgi:magnesium chelatase family protein